MSNQHPLLQQAGEDGSSSQLALTRQLVGNLDEVNGLAFIYNSSDSSSNSSSGDGDQHAAAVDGSRGSASDGGRRLVLQAHEPRRIAVSTNSHDIRLFELADASCVGGFVGHRDIVVCVSTVAPTPGECSSPVRLWRVYFVCGWGGGWAGRGMLEA